jgi:hypothetical protein
VTLGAAQEIERDSAQQVVYSTEPLMVEALFVGQVPSLAADDRVAQLRLAVDSWHADWV